MLATAAERPFSHPDWLFEPKLDGIRAVALIDAEKVRLQSRRGLDATRQFPSLVHELRGVDGHQVVLDGEIVALDTKGRPSFERLQQRLNLTKRSDILRAEERFPVSYYLFDCLYLDGLSLLDVPLQERKQVLKRLLVPSERVGLVEHFDEQGETAFQAALEHGLEGIVAKRRDSPYQPGRRSPYWLKIKATLSDEFVIGGFSEGRGGRADTFGALLLGQYQDDRLLFAGNVGSGFDSRSLADLLERLHAIVVDKSPFADHPPAIGRTTWVRPELVAEVKFAERTREGRLRAPVFLRLRPDRVASEVHPTPVVPTPVGTSRREDRAPVLADVAAVLEQLERGGERSQLQLQGHVIPLTNLNKALWPTYQQRPPLTKRDLLVYLARVSPYLLPHMVGRPLTLVRYPHGIDGERFFQKQWGENLPEFVETVRVFSEQSQADKDYLLCNNLLTLLWLGQIADLELHTWCSRVDPEPDGHHLSPVFAGSAEQLENSLLNYPDFLLFDLDPYLYSGKEPPGAEPELHGEGFAKTCQVAIWLREVLEDLSLNCSVKTSGRTGLHVVVPIRRQFSFEVVRSLSATICGFLVRQHPEEVTTEWSVANRTGKVFLDYNQNARGKTIASIYSPRDTPAATVSMPLVWQEVGRVFPTDFTLWTAPGRLEQSGDLWVNMLESKQDLAILLEMVDGERSEH